MIKIIIQEDFDLVQSAADQSDAEEWVDPEQSTNQKTGNETGSDEFDFSEFSKFHKKLNFDSVEKIVRQTGNKSENESEVKSEPEETQQEVGTIVPAVQINKPEVKIEPEVVYLDESKLKPLMNQLVRIPRPRKKALLPVGEEAEVWHYSLDTGLD